MIVTKALKKNPKESYSKFYNLVSAMNYGRVVQNKNYKVDMNWQYSEQEQPEQNMILVDSKILTTPADFLKYMWKAKIVLTTDCDLNEFYKQIIE